MGKKQQYLTVDGRKIPVSNFQKVLYPTPACDRFRRSVTIHRFFRVARCARSPKAPTRHGKVIDDGPHDLAEFLSFRFNGMASARPERPVLSNLQSLSRRNFFQA
jgi:hypothetical protein